MTDNGEGIIFKKAMNGYKNEEVNNYILELNKKLKNATEAFNQERDALERKIESLEEQNADLIKQLDEKDMLMKSAIAEYEVKYSDACREIENTKERSEELFTKISELENENSSLKSTVEQYKVEEHTAEQNEADKAELSELRSSNASLEAEMTLLHVKISSLEAELEREREKQAEPVVPTVVYQHADDNKLAGLRSDKTSLEADVAVLRAKVASLESELADARAKASESIDTCDNDIKEKARKYDELRNGVGEIILKANVISVELVENARLEAEKILSEANGRAEYIKSQLTKTATDITDFLKQLSERTESTSDIKSDAHKDE